MADGKNHTVAQGEHLSSIARDYGFASYKTIWDAPENKQLKDKRKNPSILFPGDKVFIPNKKLREEPAATEKRHRFRLAGKPPKLRIVLMDLNREKLAGHKGLLVVEADAKEFTTSNDGKIERVIPETASTGNLIDRGNPNNSIAIERDIPLKIAHLDPADTVSGQIARLNNLGYSAGELSTPLGNPTEEQQRFLQFESAVEEFQCDYALKVDGICGKKTQDKLVEAHGC